MKLTHVALTVAFALAPVALFAQQTTTPVAPVAPVTPVTTPVDPTHNPKDATGKSIAERKTIQQDRIANGIKDDDLTAKQASKLEGQEAGINKEESGMREQDNGKLTKSDKETLTRQQNAESRRIRRDERRTMRHK